MKFLKVFSLFAVFLILVSMYNISDFIACKNYAKCVQHTMSGRIIILVLVLSLALVNKYMAALVVIFLAIFLFDLQQKNGVYDLYNCKIMEDKIKIDSGITERLDEKLSKKLKKDSEVLPRDGEIISTPSSVLINESDEIPKLNIRTIRNVKFQFS